MELHRVFLSGSVLNLNDASEKMILNCRVGKLIPYMKNSLHVLEERKRTLGRVRYNNDPTAAKRAYFD